MLKELSVIALVMSNAGGTVYAQSQLATTKTPMAACVRQCEIEGWFPETGGDPSKRSLEAYRQKGNSQKPAVPPVLDEIESSGHHNIGEFMVPPANGFHLGANASTITNFRR